MLAWDCLTKPARCSESDSRIKAAAGLPLSADINSITDYWDDSITDQIVPPADGGASEAAQATAAHQLQTTPRLSHHGADLSATTAQPAQPQVEMAGPFCEAGSVMAAPQAQLQSYDEQLNLSLWSENSPLLLNEYHTSNSSPSLLIWLKGSLPLGLKGPVEFSSEHGQLQPVQSQGQGQLSSAPGQLQSSLGQVQLPGPSSGPEQAWVINPEQIKVCEHPRGCPGSWGWVASVCFDKKLMQFCGSCEQDLARFCFWSIWRFGFYPSSFIQMFTECL
ncbi:TPA: hypothetical protein ACH3X1_011354 [Trebouxia sp. C0004]